MEYISIIRTGKKPQTKKGIEVLGVTALPGGKDDPGLMESDIGLLIETILENAHPDFTAIELYKIVIKYTKNFLK